MGTGLTGKHKIIVHGYPMEGLVPLRKTKVSLWFDAEGILLNPIALASSSMVGWGKWQSSARVKTRWGPAWWCSTAGHGGYLLVTQTLDTPFGEPTWRLDHEAGKAYLFEFEEDCAWAMLEYADQSVAQQMLRRSKHTVQERIEAAKTTLAHYFPDFIAKKDY